MSYDLCVFYFPLFITYTIHDPRLPRVSASRCLNWSFLWRRLSAPVTLAALMSGSFSTKACPSGIELNISSHFVAFLYGTFEAGMNTSLSTSTFIVIFKTYDLCVLYKHFVNMGYKRSLLRYT